jgi:hypothetical protein
MKQLTLITREDDEWVDIVLSLKSKMIINRAHMSYDGAIECGEMPNERKWHDIFGFNDGGRNGANIEALVMLEHKEYKYSIYECWLLRYENQDYLIVSFEV